MSDAVEKAIQSVYEGRIKQGDLDAGTWAANVRELWKATNQGGAFKTNYQGSTDNELAAALRHNIYVFGAFKNHAMVGDMVALLLDRSGNLRPFDEFKRMAAQVSQDYNKHWLQAEYDTAVATGQAAARWKDIERSKKALPFLKYQTAGDERVRLSHKRLDGIVRHVDDPFWDEWFPPNGWRCRCDVQQVAGGETPLPDVLPNDTETPLTFRNNPGKSGQVFTLQHPYFQLVQPEQRRNVLRAAGSLIFDNYAPGQYLKTDPDASEAFRALRKFTGALGYDATSGGFTILNRKHSAAGITDEIPVLNILRRRGAMLELLDQTKGTSGNDLFWDGHFWDIKRLSRANNLNNRLHKIFQKARRAGRLKILLHVDMDVSDTALMDGLHNMLRQSPSVKLVNVVWGSGRSVRLTAEDIKAKRWPK